MFAQHAAKYLSETSGGVMCYLATMIPMDDEDLKRVSRHIADRQGWGFITIEEGLKLPRAAKALKGDEVVLFDSLTALVQNNMFEGGDYRPEYEAENIKEELKELAKACKHLIIVSDCIFSDALIYDEITEAFRRILGHAQIQAACVADVVLECAFSNIKVWKNEADIDIKAITDMYYTLNSHLTYGDI
ncbi:MAG: adenosylcobinamide kinase/adenosylcobinamide-phosphate guanylyltransferase [Eubacteriaceae bacterium]|nr:adenosylcobinamide kinase/adenosylcobinamide-phosphate guanylyltransferase [Eubacteriaceae bacterium]